MMPLPYPTEIETSDEFILRATGHPAMVAVFPDAEHRRKICRAMYARAQADIRSGQCLAETGRMPRDAETRATEDVERRIVRWPAAELRVAPAADEFTDISGRFLYESLSENLGGFREMVMPGAFAKSLAAVDEDLTLDIEHDPSQVLARRFNRTLWFEDEPKELRFTARLLTASPLHRHIIEAVKTKLVDGVSPAWRRRDVVEEFVNKNGQKAIRKVNEAWLLGLALTHRPAYRSTTLYTAATVPRHNPSELSPRRLRLAMAEKVTADDDRRARGNTP